VTEPGQFSTGFKKLLLPVPDGLVPAADAANEKVDDDDSFLSPVAGEAPVAMRPVSISCSAI
jgi:hypothetical protein